MDKTSRFRIDSYEATEKQRPVAVKKASEPMLFQSYQLAVGDVLPMAIDFQCLKGSRFGFAYAYMSKVAYVSDAANERVEINFSGGEVVVRGVNLTFIYEALLNRKLVWLREVNIQLLERYQELRPVNDNRLEDIPVVIEIFQLIKCSSDIS